VSVNGIILVTSPQSLATMIVKKALDMAQKMNTSVLGVIENMAEFVAPDTGTHYEIFGPSHAMEVAEAAGAPLLARLPIDPQFAEHCDAGEIEMLPTDALNACVEALAQKQAEAV
jgi:ATP-binding protein involved in chromosome partitioning